MGNVDRPNSGMRVVVSDDPGAIMIGIEFF
jgi:hypothetical protein